MEEDEYRALKSDPAAVDHLFKELARQRLESYWVTWLNSAWPALASNASSPAATTTTSVLEPLYWGTQSFFGCENKMILRGR
jgi:hypothetical protein